MRFEKRGKRIRTFETLEQRTPKAGFTLITHGFDIGDDPKLPQWVDALAQDIRLEIAASYLFPGAPEYIARFNLELTQKDNKIIPRWDYSRYKNPYALGQSPLDYDLKDSFQGEAVITLDWSAIASVGEITTNQLGKVVADFFLNEDWNLARQLLSSDIHLIGHSRGASLVGAIAENLGKEGIFVDQLTSLDARPILGDYGFFTIPKEVPANVIFADSYYRKFSPLSSSVAGTFQADLSDIVNNGAYVNIPPLGEFIGAHSNVHLWYQGTVKRTQLISDGAINDFDSQAAEWYTNYDQGSSGFQLSSGLTNNRPISGITNTIPFLSGRGVRKPIIVANEHPTIFIQDNPFLITTKGIPIPLSAQIIDNTKNVTITVGIDTDTNPYNGVVEGTKQFQTKDLSDKLETTIDTETLSDASPYYAFAKIDDGQRVVYDYNQNPLTIVPNQRTTDFATKLFTIDKNQANPSDQIQIDFEFETKTLTNQEGTLEVYLSTDQFIDGKDYILSQISFQTDPQTQSISDTQTVFLPPQCNDFWQGDATYYVGAIVNRADIFREIAGFNNANQGEGIDIQLLTILNTCPSQPQIKVSPLEDIVTFESRSLSQITLTLTNQPTDSVLIKASVTDESEGTISPSQVLFTKENWQIPQAFTLTGVLDSITDGDQNYFVELRSLTQDPSYQGLSQKIEVTNNDLGAFPWQNPLNPNDTDGDGYIVPLDVLRIINYLNSPVTSTDAFLDINNDQFISPLDALIVINYLTKDTLSNTVIQSISQEPKISQDVYQNNTQQQVYLPLSPQLVDQAITQMVQISAIPRNQKQKTILSENKKDLFSLGDLLIESKDSLWYKEK